MSQARFTLPAGVDLAVEDGKLNVRYDGDVTLEQSMGLELGSVHAGGDLHVALPTVTGSLVAGGALSLEGAIDAQHVEAPALTLPDGARIASVATPGNLTCGGLEAGSIEVGGDLSGSDVNASGDITVGGALSGGAVSSGGALTVGGNTAVDTLSGRTVYVSGGSVKAKAISASESITVGPGKITVDVLIAPSVTIDPGASGRVTVIESHNERGATKIKGGLSVADYDEIIGGADEFLAERGVARLGASGGPEPEPEPASSPMDFGPDIEEDDEDPLSVSMDDLEPLEALVDPEVVAQLGEAMAKIRRSYQHSESPPTIDELGRYIDDAKYGDLKDRITDIWTGLIDFHQQRGIRPPHQVTHAFNVIHGLVQELG